MNPHTLSITPESLSVQSPRQLMKTGVASKELSGAEQKLPGQDEFLSALPRPPAGPYAVEKLIHHKMAEKTLQ